jgi:Subtilase family
MNAGFRNRIASTDVQLDRTSRPSDIRQRAAPFLNKLQAIAAERAALWWELTPPLDVCYLIRGCGGNVRRGNGTRETSRGDRRNQHKSPGGKGSIVPVFAALTTGPTISLAAQTDGDVLSDRRRFIERGLAARLQGRFGSRLPDSRKRPRIVPAGLFDGDDDRDDDSRVTTTILPAVQAVLVSGPEEVQDHLLVDPDVSRIVLADQHFASVPTPSSGATTGTPWHLNACNIPTARARGLRGHGVWIGVADTGIDISHAEFDASRITFAEFSRNGNQVRVAPLDRDPAGHGTHVSGVLAGKNVGVAPDAHIAVASIFGKRMDATFGSVIKGLDWLASMPRPDRNTTGVDVINVSFITDDGSGSAAYNSTLRPVIASIRGLGITVIAAIGNSGPGTHGSPGNYAQALGVGAIDQAMNEWNRSCGGVVPPPENCKKPDFLAPGVDIFSAESRGSYRVRSGTSFAAPVVTGLAALICEEKKARHIIDAELRRRAKPGQAAGPQVVSF